MNNKYVKLEDVCSMLENAQIISDGEYSGYCTEDIDLSKLPTVTNIIVRKSCCDCQHGTKDWLDKPCSKCVHCREDLFEPYKGDINNDSI